MNQHLKERIEHLIKKGEEILNLTTTRFVEHFGSREVLGANGSELFLAWKISSKKALKQINEIDYDSFIKYEKSTAIDTQPRILKRLLAVLKASLDDLNSNIVDMNTAKPVKENSASGDTIHYHSLNNYGNMASHNEISTITQNSKLVINKGNFNSLASILRSYGIQEVDIQELQNIIDVTPLPQSPSEYSPDLKNWMTKMIGKSIDGTWQVAISAAGNLLATGIQQYFGIPN